MTAMLQLQADVVHDAEAVERHEHPILQQLHHDLDESQYSLMCECTTKRMHPTFSKRPTVQKALAIISRG